MDIKAELKRLSPVAVEVKAGEAYSWCGCGKTCSHPFCDNAHDCWLQQTFKATLNETVLFCGCSHTKNPPFCDGTHGKLQLNLLKGVKK